MIDWKGVIYWELVELMTRKKTRQETPLAIMEITEDMKKEWEEENAKA